MKSISSYFGETEPIFLYPLYPVPFTLYPFPDTPCIKFNFDEFESMLPWLRHMQEGYPSPHLISPVWQGLSRRLSERAFQLQRKLASRSILQSRFATRRRNLGSETINLRLLGVSGDNNSLKYPVSSAAPIAGPPNTRQPIAFSLSLPPS
jgi:hypothetical protein